MLRRGTTLRRIGAARKAPLALQYEPVTRRRGWAWELLRGAALELALWVIWLALISIDRLLRLVQLPLLAFERVPRIWGERKRVVIAGASFGGLAVQRELVGRRDLDVTVVDVKDYFEYTPGILRCFVRPTHLSALTCPLPRRRNELRVGEVVGVSKAAVTVVERSSAGPRRVEVPFDYLVLACGSTYQPPVKPTWAEPSLGERAASWHEAHRKLKEAEDVLIVGGGAVGVELAAEVLQQFPNKRVSLVDLATSILPGIPEQSARFARDWLEARGAVFRLGEKIAEIGQQSVTLATGEVLFAGVVYKCVGVKPNTSTLRDSPLLSEHLVGAREAVHVNAQLQLEGEGLEHIYCVGDMMRHASRELKLGHTAELNAKLVALNISRAQQRLPPLAYPEGAVGAPTSPHIFCLSLGPYDATLGFNGLLIHGWLPALAKWVLEWTKVAAAAERPVGVLFWVVADYASCLLARTVLREQP